MRFILKCAACIYVSSGFIHTKDEETDQTKVRSLDLLSEQECVLQNLQSVHIVAVCTKRVHVKLTVSDRKFVLPVCVCVCVARGASAALCRR